MPHSEKPNKLPERCDNTQKSGRKQSPTKGIEPLIDSIPVVQQIIDKTVDGIIITDGRGKIVLCNESAQELFGYEKEELAGHSFTILMPETSREESQKKMESGDVEISGKISELEGARKDGTTFPAELSINSLDINGELFYTAIIRDVSKHKDMAYKLLNAAQEWRTTFDSISDYVCMVDSEGRIVRLNIAMEKFLGMDFKDILGQNCYQLLHGDSAPIKECPINRVRETLRKETTIIQIDERWFSVSVDPILDETKNFKGVVHIMIDVTDRIKAEEALRKSEEKFRILFEKTDDFVAILDMRNIYQYVNPSHKYLGYTPEDLIGRSGYDFVHPAEVEKLKIELAEALVKGLKSKRIIFSVKDKQGGWHELESTVNLVKDKEGNNILLLISRDITERKKAEQQRRLADIGRMTGRFAHDVRNPLFVIVGSADMVLEAEMLGLGSKDIKEKALDILTNAKRINTLAAELLGFIKITSDKRTSISLKNIIGSVLENTRKTGRYKAVCALTDFKLHIPDDLPDVKGDMTQLMTVFDNLLSNSLDAIAEKAEINPYSGFIEIKVQYIPDKKCIEILCIDNGIGIKEENLEKVLEPFNSTKGSKGTGLGLPSVRSVIENHEGILDIASRYGEGTTIRITLPTE